MSRRNGWTNYGRRIIKDKKRVFLFESGRIVVVTPRFEYSWKSYNRIGEKERWINGMIHPVVVF